MYKRLAATNGTLAFGSALRSGAGGTLLRGSYPARGLVCKYHRGLWLRRHRWKILGFATGLLILLALASRGWWMDLAARSLVCEEDTAPADVLLIDNLESNYLLFEKAQQLVANGRVARVMALIPTTGEESSPGRVAKGVVDLMAEVARVEGLETIPVFEREPISINAAEQVKAHLEGDGVRSLILVTPGFRSRRSMLVYEKVFAGTGVKIHCVPVFGLKTPANWRNTWHGFEEVTLQWMKLWYYRLFVL